jgi:ATP-dependent exoDNAse (exonuclease V) alpha subunit
MSITLTDDQQAAYAALVALVTSDQQSLVISGAAGCGKTTLINTFLNEWPTICKLMNGSFQEYEPVLTATTNKAADALSSATGRETYTIHRYLGLRVESTGFKETKLVSTGKARPHNMLLIIDEASFVDHVLFNEIRERTESCKVVYLGDPMQLRPVKETETPVFDYGFPTVELNQIVRQSDGSPIQTLSRSLREFVAGKPLPNAGVNGVDILHLPQDQFEAAFIEDCKKHRGNAVRALAWTNQAAIRYNSIVAEAMSGKPEIKAGDTVVVNKQIKLSRNMRLPTDSTVFIKELGEWVIDEYGIQSRLVHLGNGYTTRQAKSMKAVDKLIKETYANPNNNSVSPLVLENTYADLRLMYASTVNKSQGSTYDIVYIDLNDISKCRDADQVRRMLYVAVSRAKHKVVFTGDI